MISDRAPIHIYVCLLERLMTLEETSTIIDMKICFLHSAFQNPLCTYHGIFMLEEEEKVCREVEEVLRFKQNVLWSYIIWRKFFRILFLFH